MIVINGFDEWLDFIAFCLPGLGHSAGDLGWVPFDPGDEGMGERVRF